MGCRADGGGGGDDDDDDLVRRNILVVICPFGTLSSAYPPFYGGVYLYLRLSSPRTSTIHVRSDPSTSRHVYFCL